jgi:hypothetical protein
LCNTFRKIFFTDWRTEMATYYYIMCPQCKEVVPFSRSGTAGHGPLTGDELRFAFLDKHDEHLHLLSIVGEGSTRMDDCTDFDKKETPDLAVSEGEHVARVVGEKSVKYLTNEEVNMQDTNIRLVMEKQALERKIDRVTRQFEMLRRGDKREREKEFIELETVFADTVWALTRWDVAPAQKETPDLADRG